mmetsp:Transcript_37546/g.91284  ORF Transcript_37546/g.91284 Transcript_37546/m.91284 type:complete len:273 (+) Transcript_37546:95-913(+)
MSVRGLPFVLRKRRHGGRHFPRKVILLKEMSRATRRARYERLSTSCILFWLRLRFMMHGSLSSPSMCTILLSLRKSCVRLPPSRLVFEMQSMPSPLSRTTVSLFILLSKSLLSACFINSIVASLYCSSGKALRASISTVMPFSPLASRAFASSSATSLCLGSNREPSTSRFEMPTTEALKAALALSLARMEFLRGGGHSFFFFPESATFGESPTYLSVEPSLVSPLAPSPRLILTLLFFFCLGWTCLGLAGTKPPSLSVLLLLAAIAAATPL